MWRYQELLNQHLQILLLLGLGALSVALKIFNQQQDLRTFNRFVFNILLPASVLLGLGLKSDLRDGSTWRFIGAFLMMRAIALVACAALFGGGLRRTVGQVTMCWLSSTWVSTVIIGVPLVRATLGAQYANLGVVAGISSFIFQLPAMLLLLEVHRGTLPTAAPHAAPPLPAENGGAAADAGKAALAAWVPSRPQLRSVGRRLLLNPVMWAILVGSILSATTLGPRYLNPGSFCCPNPVHSDPCSVCGFRPISRSEWSPQPEKPHAGAPSPRHAGNPPAQPNCDYAPGAGFINLLLSSLAACAEPVALFATGAFLVRRDPLACGAAQAAGFMLAKLVLVPALMVGCAAAVGLQGAAARAAVLLASLPISAAAIAVADVYDVGRDLVQANVFLGNLLVLPTTILWFVFMDGVGLFPAPEPTAPSVCAAPPAG